MSDQSDYGNACLRCQIRRCYDCDLATPSCQNCWQVGYTCHWDASLANIIEVWPEFQHKDLSERLVPKNPRTLGGQPTFGTGTFGEVYAARLANHNGVVAVKIPKRRNGTPVRQLALCLREAITWSTLEHPNIIGLIGVVYIVNDALYFVSDAMQDGNIMDFLRKRPHVDRIKLLCDIANGVKYLHGMTPTVVHGDLKGTNVLISPNGNACLTDFGLSCVVEDLTSSSGNDTSSAKTANPRWAAPERLFPDDYNMCFQASRTMHSDIFSMCRTFLEVLTGEIPFKAISNARVISIASVGFPYEHPRGIAAQHGLTEALWTLMQRGWNKDPKERPSAEEVVVFMESM